MNRIRSAFLYYVLPIVAAFVVAFSYDKSTSSAMNLCHHQFALCTSAQCIPQPGDPTKAICFCDVLEGPSMSSTTCESLAPSTDSNGLRTVYSSFSQEQFKTGLKGMVCPDGTPWTWCLNKRCTVNPEDPSKAICTCDVLRSGEWMTLGGNCDTTTCKTGYWSGAGLKDFAQANDFMTKALKLKESPAKWCKIVAQ